MVRHLLASLALFLVSGAAPSIAQRVDTARVTLPEIRVEAARGSVSAPADATFSYSIRTRKPAGMDAEWDGSAARLLRATPGLFASDRGHLALGDRLTLRGMGARAGFGVRGIQVVLDRIPLTLPDGQAVTEGVEAGIVRRVEVLRGPAARFWGNGSGGAILFDTFPTGDERPFVRLQVAASGFGTRSALAEASGDTPLGPVRAWFSGFGTDGFRDHAEGRLIRAGLGGQVRLLESAALRWVISGVDQDVRAPGALTASEVSLDPSTADPRYLATSSGKISRQVQAGTSLLAPLYGGVTDVSVHAVRRSLDNALPFAWIGVERAVGGVRASWRRDVGAFGVTATFDGGLQSDDRVNAANDGGREGATRSLDQRERVLSFAGAVITSWSILPSLSIQAGSRFDRLRISLDDALTLDGDQSGVRTFSDWSPSIGMRLGIGRSTVFASWSTAFESPTTTELVNRADGLGGFNPNVGPQRTQGMEAGVRFAGARMSVDFGLFDLDVDDLLGSFESQVDGRTYYRNTGRARSSGADAAFSWVLPPSIEVEATALLSRFRFSSGDLDGLRVPGVPERLGRLRFTWSPGSARVAVGAEARSSMTVDDAGTALEGSVFTLETEASWGATVGTVVLRPFAAVRNLTDARYASAILPNARAGRYFDPAPGRTLTMGLSVRY